MSSGCVAVVIVNYNGGSYLGHCLAALQAQTMPHAVLVVDNASHDGSARAAHAAFPDVTFLPLRRNVGLARAVNIAARRLHATADVLVALNPDTQPRPDFLERLVEPLGDDRVASVAGTLVFSQRPDRIASAGVSVHRNGVAIDARLGEQLADGDPQLVFGASGGAAAYRLGTFLELGGFCESFFLYLEDVDLAWRLRLRGWEAVWVPGAVATHAYSAAAGEGSAFKRRLLARNRLWTLARCLPSSIWARDWHAILAFDIGAAAYGLARGDWPALLGRAAGVLGFGTRWLERTEIQRSALISMEALNRWLEPSISGATLARYRRLTAAFAESGNYSTGAAPDGRVD